MIDVVDLQRQAWAALSGPHNAVVFRFRRPSGKDHELIYPREMFNNFDAGIYQVLQHLEHWMQYCDSQQVCPLKK